MVEEVAKLRREIDDLLAKIREKEDRINELEQKYQNEATNSEEDKEAKTLSNYDIGRYSRQLILPHFGVSAQIKFRKTSFLIVGLGGLGCPAARYLVAAGAGHLGLVDYDDVEISNLHRQTLHTEAREGMPKVLSAKMALKALNKNCKIDCYKMQVTSANAMDLLQKYNLILDCTDNVATRYLINDACVLLKKPLISGCALQYDGQLTVYNYGDLGPCYRCLFPKPPSPETVTNCGDGGVLGAVTGTIGALQALEAMKVSVSLGDILAGRLLVFDGLRCMFRNIRLRTRRIDCDVCSTKPTITKLIDYEQFCGMSASDKDLCLNILTEDQRFTVFEYEKVVKGKIPHLLLDVRQPAEFEICKLPLSVNLPLKDIQNNQIDNHIVEKLSTKGYLILCLCRRGNDSQIAAKHLMGHFPFSKIYDIDGGLHAWHHLIDPNFPIY